MTRSRMGNTAFFASLLIPGVAALVLARQAPRSTLVLVSSLIVIDLVVVGAWFGVEKTIERIPQTTQVEVEERVEPAVYAMDMVRDYPVFGAGAGGFYTAFTRYRGSDIRPFYDHAHNDYTQLLVETGVLGALLVAGLP
jgi:putative inorganic carbon (hco3(-)) transporter